MEMTVKFDDDKIFDAIVSECVRYMIDKRAPGMVGTISRDVAQQIKSEVVDSGLIEKRVEEVVKRVENSLMGRVNRQFTPVLDEAVNMAAKHLDYPTLTLAPTLIDKVEKSDKFEKVDKVEKFEKTENIENIEKMAFPIIPVKGEGRMVRDILIAALIGYQNSVGPSSPEYDAYQKVLVYIEENFGEMMS